MDKCLDKILDSIASEPSNKLVYAEKPNSRYGRTIGILDEPKTPPAPPQPPIPFPYPSR